MNQTTNRAYESWRVPPNMPLLTLLTRDHQEDVVRLNSLFSLSGEATLSTEVPPHIYVGNRKNKTPGNNILLMGINPFLSDNPEFQKHNIDTPLRCLKKYNQTNDPSSFEDWLYFQENYFLSSAYNGRHFTRIGNLIGQRWFPETYNSQPKDMASRMTLHKHLIEVDAVPYYSRKASFNSEKLAAAMRTDPALKAHLSMIESIIHDVKPRWIQVNGLGPSEVVKQCFIEGSVELLNDGPDKKTEIQVGHAIFGDQRIPVLMHKFLKSPSGPQSAESWDTLWNTWENWLKTTQ